jgi:hypothetical protein
MTRPMQAQDALPVPQSISMQSMYLAVSLELPLGLDSWGMSLSMFEGNYLIIGDAREEQAASMVRGFWSAYTPLDPAVFCRQFSVNVASFTKYLFRLSYSPTPRILLPGDCILAINGRPISHFASLAQATACFRQDRQLSLLILRHPVACAQARSFLLHQPVTTNTMTNKLKLSREYGAARCAYWIHCKSKSTSTLVGSPLQVPLQTKQSPLVRVVTVSVADKVQAPVPTGNATPLQVRKSPCTIARPRPALCIPTNPLFRDSSGQQPVHYFDNYEYDPDEGLRSQLFLRHVDSSNFSEWLHQRKQQWRGNYKVYTLQQDLVQETNNTHYAIRVLPLHIPVKHTNPLFRDPTNSAEPIRYIDDEYEYDPQEGLRAQLFLKRIDSDSSNFSGWLQERKLQWRSNYKVYTLQQDFVRDESQEIARDDSYGQVDFWTLQGYASFQHWLLASTTKWKQSYSWNQRKRKRLEKDCEEVVNLSTHSFKKWLSVRGNQWKILRRRRQRQKLEACPCSMANHGGPMAMDVDSPENPSGKTTLPMEGSPTSVAVILPVIYERTVVRSELFVIDAMLEDQQQRERKDALQREQRVDISFLFDATVGCPDDVITHLLSYLDPQEHGKLLSFSSKTRAALMKREEVWRQLCPDHWTLPRRPRKPWYELYLTQLKDETQRQRKCWDDLLSRASTILLKGDHLQTIEKLVTEAERDFRFDVNYSSGVVCERNSLLNLAVIHQRLKVAKWLVERKNADIESCDRGSFTPLLNAAWAGDKPLVRFLLQKGADRSKVGTGHYTKPLALPDFEGFTAAGWAEKRGHLEMANLIRIGL